MATLTPDNIVALGNSITGLSVGQITASSPSTLLFSLSFLSSVVGWSQSQAMATTGRIVGPVLGGLMYDSWSHGAPFLIAGGMMFAAVIMFRLFRSTLVVPDGHPESL